MITNLAASVQVARQAGARSMHLTVNSTAQDNPRQFFSSKFGFVERAAWQTDVNGKPGEEYLMCMHVSPALPGQPDSRPSQGAIDGAASSRKRGRDLDAASDRRPYRPRQIGKSHQITLKGPYIR